MKVVHSDESESKYFLKLQEFSFVFTIIRKYIRLLVPIAFATLGIKYIVPFLSNGPIYLVVLKDQLLTPCEGSWFLNLVFLQNFMFWDRGYNCESCYPYISDTFTEGKCQPSANAAIIADEKGYACKGICGSYL